MSHAQERSAFSNASTELTDKLGDVIKVLQEAGASAPARI